MTYITVLQSSSIKADQDADLNIEHLVNLRGINMINSVSGGNAPGLLTSMMNKKTTDEQIAVEVVKIGLDAQKAEGEAALKLINAAAPGGVDVHA